MPPFPAWLAYFKVAGGAVEWGLSYRRHNLSSFERMSGEALDGVDPRQDGSKDLGRPAAAKVPKADGYLKLVSALYFMISSILVQSSNKVRDSTLGTERNGGMKLRDERSGGGGLGERGGREEIRVGG